MCASVSNLFSPSLSSSPIRVPGAEIAGELTRELGSIARASKCRYVTYCLVSLGDMKSNWIGNISYIINPFRSLSLLFAAPGSDTSSTSSTIAFATATSAAPASLLRLQVKAWDSCHK